MEMLIIEYPQEIAKCKRNKLRSAAQEIAQCKCNKLRSAAQDQVRMFLERIDDETIIQSMQPFFQKIGTMVSLKTSYFRLHLTSLQDAASRPRAIVANGNPRFFRNNLLDGPKSEHKGKKKTLDVSQASKPANFGVIDLASCDIELIEKLRQGANNGRYPTLHRGTLASLQDTKALIAPGSNAKLKEMLQYSPAVLLAIIGDGHDQQQQYDALYNFADRQQGTPIVIAQKKHVEEGYDLEKVDNSGNAYLPGGLRKKLNLMCGGKNFATSGTLKTTSKTDVSRLMVVGAHISTPERQEAEAGTSHDSLYDPSIASIVASNDSSATKLLGSSRIQKSFSAMKPLNTGLKPADKNVPESRILELQAMMVERFEAWDDQAKPPTAMLFYRDAIHDNDTAVHAAEVAVIKEAYRSVFKDAKETLQVTYITAIKNGLTTERPHFLTEPKNSAAYRYFIPINEADFTPEELKEMVSRTSPIPPHNTIPLTHKNRQSASTPTRNLLLARRRWLKLCRSSMRLSWRGALMRTIVLVFRTVLVRR